MDDTTQHRSAANSASPLLNWLAERLNNGDALLLSLVVVFVPTLLSNHYKLAPQLFGWLLVPVAILSWLKLRVESGGERHLFLSARISLAFSIVLLAIATYVGMVALSSAIGAGAERKLVDRQWMYAAEIVIFVSIVACSVSSFPRFALRLIAALAALVAANAFINLADFLYRLNPDADIIRLRMVSTFGMPGYTNATNISATFAIFFVASVAIIVTGRLSKMVRLWLVPVALILLCGVLATQSRSAYVGIIVGLGLVLWTAPFAFRRAAVASFVGGIALGAVVIMLIPQTRAVVLSRGESYRPEIWKIYSDRALQKPLIGYGGLADIGIRLKNDVEIDQPHNLVLSAQIRGGIFAAMAMIVMLLGSLYWSARYLQLGGDVIPLAMIATIATAGMFDYNLLVTPITWPWITFWLPLAICAGAELAIRRGRVSELA